VLVLTYTNYEREYVPAICVGLEESEWSPRYVVGVKPDLRQTAAFFSQCIEQRTAPFIPVQSRQVSKSVAEFGARFLRRRTSIEPLLDDVGPVPIQVGFEYQHDIAILLFVQRKPLDAPIAELLYKTLPQTKAHFRTSLGGGGIG
jgi:hypothetical protein